MKSMKKAKEAVVISLGGSVVNPGKLDIPLIKKFGNLLIGLKTYKFGVIVGGGKLYRDVLDEVLKYCKDKKSLDWIGIHCTRVNAQCVLSYFINKKQNIYPEVSLSSKESAKLLKKHNFVFQGGDKPGYTSDMDAVELAVLKGKNTKIINISNVDGVYTKDPNKYKGAKKIKEITHKELSKIILKQSGTYEPGQNLIFDQMATRLAQKHNIELHFISAKNIKDIEKVLKGEKHRGTVVKD